MLPPLRQPDIKSRKNNSLDILPALARQLLLLGHYCANAWRRSQGC
jgi:hypothetical protein